MAKRCAVTGKQPGYGKRVAHSGARTNRRFLPNLQRHRYWLASENRWVRLRLSAKGIKTVDKHGIEAVVARLRERGERV